MRELQQLEEEEEKEEEEPQEEIQEARNPGSQEKIQPVSKSAETKADCSQYEN